MESEKRSSRALRWLRTDFAEWLVGSWALLLGWGIIIWIFSRLIVMDGHFSRTLGEGSSVDPDLFQHVGWAYRLFAASFLVIAFKMSLAGLTWSAWAIRILGGFCTLLVIMHAVGFGLEALSGKRIAAEAEVREQVATGDAVEVKIERLETQKETIRSDLATAIAPLQERMAKLDSDGRLNEDRTDALQARVEKLEDGAQVKIDEIDAKIFALTETGGVAATDAAASTVADNKWTDLFVGMAQLAEGKWKPDDNAIYLAGVLFTVFWVLVGDGICIAGPECLYKLHLKDRQAGHREKAKAYDDWRAKQSEAGKKGAKRRQRNEKVRAARLAIADYSAKAKEAATPLDEDAEDAPETPDEAPDAVAETDADLSADNEDDDERPAPDIKAAE